MIAEKLLAFTLLGAGWVLWLLLGLSVISVAVMIERTLYFARRRMSSSFEQLLKLCQSGDLTGAAKIATTDSMEADVVRTAASVAAGGNEAVEKAVQSTIDRRRLQYEQWLFVLGTLGNNAPFIGLFGTVLGIIRAFADLAVANKGGGANTAGTVMAGISEALVATAVGLFVAIPAVLAFNIFQRLLKRVIGRSNALGNAISSGLHAKGEPMAGQVEPDDDGINGINVTPLVDITLVLLIIFMVTATYIVKETIEIELPRAANGGATVQKTFAVLVTKEGKTFLNGAPIDDDGLIAAVKTAKAAGEDVQAIVGADKNATHGMVTHLLDILKGAGVLKFAIQIEKQQ